MQNDFLTPYKEDSGVPPYLPFPRFLVPMDLSNDAKVLYALPVSYTHLNLVYKDKAWYLYAFCLSRNENRLFRLSRIKNLILTEVHFEHKTDICQYHSVFPMPEEIGDLIDLELEFTLDVGYRLFDTLDDTAITQHENGYTVKLTLPENDWLYDFLMSFGNKVTIIRPKSIRQALKAKHEAARDHHKGD